MVVAVLIHTNGIIEEINYEEDKFINMLNKVFDNKETEGYALGEIEDNGLTMFCEDMIEKNTNNYNKKGSMMIYQFSGQSIKYYGKILVVNETAENFKDITMDKLNELFGLE